MCICIYRIVWYFFLVQLSFALRLRTELFFPLKMKMAKWKQVSKRKLLQLPGSRCPSFVCCRPPSWLVITPSWLVITGIGCIPLSPLPYPLFPELFIVSWNFFQRRWNSSPSNPKPVDELNHPLTRLSPSITHHIVLHSLGNHQL